MHPKWHEDDLVMSANKLSLIIRAAVHNRLACIFIGSDYRGCRVLNSYTVSLRIGASNYSARRDFRCTDLLHHQDSSNGLYSSYLPVAF